MKAPVQWRTLKVRTEWYDALGACSRETGKSILHLGDEAMERFVKDVVPLYIDFARQARQAINGKAPRRRRRRGIETVTISKDSEK